MNKESEERQIINRIRKYRKSRRRRSRKKMDAYHRQQRSMRETNEARIRAGRGRKGGGTFRGVDDQGLEE